MFHETLFFKKNDLSERFLTLSHKKSATHILYE